MKVCSHVYTSEDDQRLQYLVSDFLEYFSEWKANVANRAGQFSKSEISKMQLSYQTLQGLEITVKSVVECVKIMLAKGAPYVRTDHFNQDPIEQYFGILRTSGGCNNNPTLEQFNHSMVNIRVAGSQALAPFRGNTRRNIQRDFALESQPLSKKKR
ncbi:unnamed protein product [Mytilus coruscus]|uniref:Transposable element P transposase-like RNase H C-terminal domain-containing protein n=1 Tax=Mytilus coruscus TaxID=42192 RepID=A0A6J8CGU5_MYTCO|nr:unnamed protein product [Mytilus coruscus]